MASLEEMMKRLADSSPSKLPKAKKALQNKKSAVTTTTKNGKVDVGLQKALKTKKKTGNKDTRLSPGAFGGKIKTVSKTDKKKIVKVTPKTKTDSKSKVSATAGNTKNFASTMAMQKKLIKMGAKIKADGMMGPKTRAAMAKFMKAPVPKARPSKTMVDSFKKSNVSANKNKKAGIDGAMGDNKKPKTFKSSNSKLDSKGNYKGSNIKPTKLQLERMKKRRARASST